MRCAGLRMIVLPCAVVLVVAGVVQHQPASAQSGAIPSAKEPWSRAELIEPATLAQRLSARPAPVIIHIGVASLYRAAHVPGSTYAGPASTAEGLEALRKQVQHLPRSTEVVVYCGCCPWAVCPNLRPAYAALKAMGFKKIALLHLPDNFGQDWVKKGLPVEKGRR